jgi:hypothetical protein
LRLQGQELASDLDITGGKELQMVKVVGQEGQEHSRSLRGVLAGEIKRSLPQRSWRRALEAAWRNAVVGKADGKKADR